MTGPDALAQAIQGPRTITPDIAAYTGTLVQVSSLPVEGSSSQGVGSATVNVDGALWQITRWSGPFLAEVAAAGNPTTMLVGRQVRVFLVDGQAEVAYTIDPATAVESPVNPQLVGSVYNTVARDNLYQSAIGAGLTGMVCYVQDRDGWCVYRTAGRGWVWMPYGTPLYDGYWSGPAQQAGTTPQVLLNSGSLTIPGTGQRRIGIVASVDVEAATGEVGARAFLCGNTSSTMVPGIAVGQNFLQAHVDAVSALYRHTVSRSWNVNLTGGSQGFILACLVEGTGNTASFNDMTLQIEDRGPIN